MIEGLGLRDAKHSKGVAVERLAFQRTLHERPCKAPADARQGGPIKVAATAATFGDLPQMCPLCHPRRIELRTPEPAGIQQPAQDHQAADFEPSCQPGDGFVHRLSEPAKNLAKVGVEGSNPFARSRFTKLL